MPPRKSDKIRARQAMARPMSRESTHSSRALSRASTAGRDRVSSVLTDGSLAVLARVVGPENNNGLVLCLYLNIPNTTIVNATNEASDTGHLGASDTQIIETTQRLLLTWKQLREESKDTDKVKDLERAFKQMGKSDFADVINEKHSNKEELALEHFPS